MRWFALLVCAVTLTAGDAALAPFSVQAHGPVRANGLLRVTVHRPFAADETDVGPVSLTTTLFDQDTILAQDVVTCQRLHDLSTPLTVVLATGSISPGPLRLVTLLTRPGILPGTQTSEQVVVPVTTPGAVLLAATAAIAVLRSTGDRNPLPWLWAEQAGELGNDRADLRNTTMMSALIEQIVAWNRGVRPAPPGVGSSIHALRDPIDDSVQPFRLHLPPGVGPFPVAVMAWSETPSDQLGKSRWPTLPEPWVNAASAAGIAIVECYPAGDRHWNGAAATRLRPTLDTACRIAALDRQRGVVICRDNPLDAPYAVQRPQALADIHWWKAALGPAVVPRQAIRREVLSGFADAPFTVVVGTGEHRAAVAANRQLAAAFQAAWSAHAHAQAPQVDDDTNLAALTGRNLVLIGNPRSNRILATLAPSLPYTWDHRQVSGSEGFQALRSSHYSVACATLLPDSRLLVILDGEPPPWGTALPMAELGAKYAQQH